jgi:NAD-dependent SIR2 family protein deacetylase
MRHEIPAALTEASASARVIVLTGAGASAPTRT